MGGIITFGTLNTMSYMVWDVFCSSSYNNKNNLPFNNFTNFTKVQMPIGIFRNGEFSQTICLIAIARKSIYHDKVRMEWIGKRIKLQLTVLVTNRNNY